MTINNNIRILRTQRHLSQEAFGELIGVSGQAVSKWEQGLTSPDISLLPIIAGCFSVTIDSLFHGADERRYPGYGSERNEFLAIYTSENGTDADFVRAEEAYRDRILRGKAVSEDYVNYGILHRTRAARDTETALRYFRLAISEGNDTRDQFWVTAHQYITNLLESTGRLDEAVAEYRLWCESEPDCALAYTSYAYALEKSGKLEEACEAIAKALHIQENDVNVQTMAGDLFAKAGKHEAAISHWDKAFALDSSCISCLFSKAEMFSAMGENSKAIAEYENILAWLEQNGYNMKLEGIHPLRRIEQLRNQQ